MTQASRERSGGRYRTSETVLDDPVRVQGDRGGYPREVAWVRPSDVLAAMSDSQKAALAGIIAVVIDMPEHGGSRIAAGRSAVEAICSLPLDPRPTRVERDA